MKSIIFLALISLSSMLSSNAFSQNLSLSVSKIFSTQQEVSIRLNLGYYYYRDENESKAADTVVFNLYRPSQQEAFLIDVLAGGESIHLSDSVLSNAQFIKNWTDSFIRENWGENEVSVGKLSSGVYIIEALHENKATRLPILVSDYALLSKKKGNEIISFVADIESGLQQPDFDISLVNDEKLIAPNKQENGIHIFETSSIDDRRYKLLGKFENQLTASHFYYYSYREEDQQIGLLFSDRPAYRPGQQVFFQGLIRDTEGYNFTVTNDTLTVKIRDERGEEIYNKKIKCNEQGSFSDSLFLKENASLGTYTITASTQERESFGYYYQNISGTFRVEEYKKPEYEVNISLDKSQYISGENIKASIQANYFFGAPVKNASVNYRIVRELYYVPWYAYYNYSWWYDDWNTRSNSNGELIKNETAELDENGTFKVSFPTDSATLKNYRYKILVDVTDASRRSISSSVSTLVTATAFTLTVNAEKFYYKTDEEVVVRVNAADFANNPVENAISFKVRKYNNSDEVPKPIYSTNSKTDENGIALLRFNVEEPGYYQLEVSALDKNYKEVKANSSVYILKEGQNAYSWWGNESAEIQIITDKKVYQAGDTLNAMIMAPNATDALVTLDGKVIIHKKIQRFNIEGTDSFMEYQIPLEEGLYGSLNLNVVYVSEGKSYNRSENITVIPADKYLNVAIEFSESTYKPGNTAEATVIVKDAEGNPVTNALVSLSTADESIYFLYPDKTTDIRKSFYPNTSIQTYTYINTFNQSKRGEWVNYPYLNSLMESEKFEPKASFFVPEGKDYLLEGGSKFFLKQHKISGYVVDEQTGKLLEGVKINSGKTKVKTNKWGYYELIKPKDTSITFSYKKSKVTFTNAFVFKESNARYNEVHLNLSLGGSLKNHKKISPEDDIFYPRFVELPDGEEIEEEIEIDLSLSADEETVVEEIAILEESADGFGSYQMLASAPMRRSASGLQTNNEVQPVIRQNFKDAIYWNPNVTTDSEGKASVKITLPDNLTTWRTTAKVITPDTKVGQTFAKVVVKKDLLLRMETPRFFRTGDKLLIATTVHNYLKRHKRVRVALKANGITVKGTNKYIYISAGGEEKIDWEVTANWPGDAILTAEAVTNEESDAKKVSVPVQANGLEMVSAYSAVLKESNKETIEFFIPEEVDLNTINVELSTAPSVAAALLGSLDQLIGYPYGCVEQTMSRFLPTLIVANTLKQLKGNYTSGISDTELEKMTAQGLTRLGELQHSDGGWGWWENDDTHPFMTAYVVNGLSLAAQTGYKVPETLLKEGKMALSNLVVNAKKSDTTTYAYQAMALMQAGITDMWDKLEVPNATSLDAYQSALWLQAAQLANNKEVSKAMLQRLEEIVIKDGSLNYWGGKKFYYSWQDDRVETTAHVVKALSMENTQHSLIPGAIQWLMQKRRGNGWHNTRQTAFTVLGLQKVIASEINPDYQLIVSANGKKLLDSKISDKDVFEKAKSLTLKSENFTASTTASHQAPTGVLKHGKNLITVEKRGPGTTYANATLTYFLQKGSKTINTVKSNSLTVERDYFSISPQQKETGEITYSKKPIAEANLLSGSEVLVKVKIASEKDLDYVLIEDPIPAGFEFIRDKSGYNIEGEEAYQGGNYYRSYFRWMNQAHTEYRDNRYAIVLTKLYKGVYEYSYIIKAQIPGTFEVNPAVVQLMYYPEKRGFSDFEEISIK